MTPRSTGAGPISVTRTQVLEHRFVRHGLHADPDSTSDPSDLALLDLGIQDTGPDGSRWAMAVRGLECDDADLAMAWTWRGAPHRYRRRDLPELLVATAPFSESDAAKRVFDASKPLKEAGIPVLDALTTIADHLRDIVDEPMVKGDVSTDLTRRLDAPFLRECRPCGTTHIYEQPFRLAALQAGLELDPGTAPPVMRRIEGVTPTRFTVTGSAASPMLHAVRVHLRFFGPARPTDVAGAIDSPVKEVTSQWPDDVVEVTITDGGADVGRVPYVVLAEDAEALVSADGDHRPVVRLLGPYDPYLQLRDRELLVADATRRKQLWPVLGRPGAVVVDGEVVGTWRPKASGRRLRVRIDPWTRWSRDVRAEVEAGAERIAAGRGIDFAGLIDE
ncbi:MAG: DNA glycosylase AlkZ-like family protein [Acidimicrobiales bacterium]